MVARGLRSTDNAPLMIKALVRCGWVTLNEHGRYVLTDTGKAELPTVTLDGRTPVTVIGTETKGVLVERADGARVWVLPSDLQPLTNPVPSNDTNR